MPDKKALKESPSILREGLSDASILEFIFIFFNFLAFPLFHVA